MISQPRAIYSYPDFGARGRLGNQLFHIAGTYGVARQYGGQCLLPKWDYKRYFNVPDIFGRATERALDARVPIAGMYHWFPTEVLQIPNLWEDCEVDVRDMFTPTVHAISRIAANPVLGIIYDTPTWTAVHIRRGDYVDLPDLFPPVDLFYLTRAIEALESEWDQIYVFTDDPQWAKENLTPLYPKCRVVESRAPDVLELLTMSLADKIVCSNSTFSWWAAYLSSSRHVVTPERWFGSHFTEDPNNGYNGEYLKLPEWLAL